jgi:hypothetical protein
LFTRIRPDVQNIIGAIEDGHSLPALQRRADLHRGHGAVEVDVALLPAALNLAKLLCLATEWQKKAKDKGVHLCAALHCSPPRDILPTLLSQRKDPRPAIAHPFKSM